jgi:hypothetical protein
MQYGHYGLRSHSDNIGNKCVEVRDEIQTKKYALWSLAAAAELGRVVAGLAAAAEEEAVGWELLGSFDSNEG